MRLNDPATWVGLALTVALFGLIIWAGFFDNVEDYNQNDTENTNEN